MTRNIIVSTTAKAELQILDERFKKRFNDATKGITNIQNNSSSAADSSKNNNEVDPHSGVPPPAEEPPD